MSSIKYVLDLSKLTRDHVLSTYVGADGACCCGCAGEHMYLEATRELAGKERGYDVDEDEVNEDGFDDCLEVIRDNAEDAEVNEDHVAVRVCGDVHIAYFHPDFVKGWMEVPAKTCQVFEHPMAGIP